MTTANARTDGQGQALVAGESYKASDVPLNANRKSPWDTKINFKGPIELGDLFGPDYHKYNLLVNHPVHGEKIPPESKAFYGTSGMVRAIKVNGNLYRANGYYLLSKNETST